MSESKKILYRLAELMLDAGSNELSVDSLFDNPEIGDSVRSIQIDSPYQQMLLQGVLTESVRVNELKVRFTFEGYFQFLIGQVILRSSSERNLDLRLVSLSKNTIESSLSGGIQEFLKAKILSNKELDLLRYIEKEIDISRFLTIPISLYLSANIMDSTPQRIYIFLEKLLKKNRKITYQIIYDIIELLKKNEKYREISVISEFIFEKIDLDDYEAVRIFICLIEFIKFEERKKTLFYLKNQLTNNTQADPYYLSLLGEEFRKIENYPNAIVCHKLSIQLQNRAEYRDIKKLAETFHNLGITFFEKGESKKSIYYLNKSIKLWGFQSKYSLLEEAVVLDNLGNIYSSSGDFENSKLMHEKSIQLFLTVSGRYSRNYARCSNNFGAFLRRLGEYKLASEHLSNSYEISKKLGFNQLELISLSNLSLIYQDLWGLNQHSSHLKKAIKIQKYVLKERFKNFALLSNEIATNLNNLGSMYCDLSEYGLAIKSYKKSLFYRRKVLSRHHIEIGLIYSNIAISYIKLKNISLAYRYLKDAYYVSKCNESTTDTCLILHNIGFFYESFGNYSKAIRFYRKSVITSKKNNLNDCNLLFKTYFNLGSIYIRLNEFKNSSLVFLKVLDMYLKFKNKSKAKLLAITENIAFSYFQVADYENALKYYLIILNKLKNSINKSLYSEADFYFYTAECLYNINKYYESINYYKRVYEIEKKGSIPFKIATIYEKMNNNDKAFKFFLESAIRRKQRVGLNASETLQSVIECLRLSKEINRFSELPEWIKKMANKN
jgi:tetratricopeptide (TPR) repeat protein